MLYTLLIFLYLIRISKYILFLYDSYNMNMNSITLKKVSSAFRDNYQKYRIPIINKESIDKSLEAAKSAILNTSINISTKFNRFKAAIILEVDLNVIESESIEIGHGKIDKYDIDIMIIDVESKYEQELSHIENVYIYSAYLIINRSSLKYSGKYMLL